ncbi:hypothetical protein IGI04_028384 [Brassica rapa subsp. trilocularis]|uniref:Protein SIEVE ELEMENT OCCLUSION C n=1 Tax=Brassica rapa subsp. trilocularis TaxID=1813537 RepID=A0ABQ7L1T1_BRACM|nr:hypothetical protein IGI04_028384 [Brassica rapa subsp. trilocularis]
MDSTSSISALTEDIIVEQILRTHDPDGRWIDSKTLLQEVEAILSFVLQSDVSKPLLTENCMTDIEVFESKETLPYAISRISVQMLCPCMGENEIHTRTMVLFDLLKEYRWDAKAVLVLGALAATYGGLLLPIHLGSNDPVAASIATLNQLPMERTTFRPWLNPLSLLIKVLVDVTKCITEFERLPFKQAKVDSNLVGETMSKIRLATYWVVKSALACLQQIPYFKQPQQVHFLPFFCFKQPQQVNSLKYSGNRIKESCRGTFQFGISVAQHAYPSQQASRRMQYTDRLRNINRETHQDNQEVLQLLFSLQDDLLLQQYSRQIAITDLKEKVILLLLSKPELSPTEPFHFLLQQLYHHPSNTNTEILWTPIPASQKWTEEEKQTVNFSSNSLPCISVKRPWLMSSTVLNFLRTEWPYRDGETMVAVMDTNGKVVNMNAMDMVLIWGGKAYPFTASREDELWEEDHTLSLQLMLDGIHPEFNTWVKEGREICLLGSDDSNWVDEINSLARKLQNLGFEFELIDLSKRTVDSMEESSIQELFWLRLESIKRSKLKRIESSNPDRVFEEVTELLEFDSGEQKGWAVVGNGSTAEKEKIVGEKLTERMRRIVRWGECAAGMGFAEAIRIAEEEEPCEESHTVVVPFEEGLRVVTCEKCKRPMKKFVAYQ